MLNLPSRYQRIIFLEWLYTFSQTTKILELVSLTSSYPCDTLFMKGVGASLSRYVTLYVTQYLVCCPVKNIEIWAIKKRRYDFIFAEIKNGHLQSLIFRGMKKPTLHTK